MDSLLSFYHSFENTWYYVKVKTIVAALLNAKNIKKMLVTKKTIPHVEVFLILRNSLTKRNVNTFLVLQRSTPMRATHSGPTPFCSWDSIGAHMGCPRQPTWGVYGLPVLAITGEPNRKPTRVLIGYFHLHHSLCKYCYQEWFIIRKSSTYY